MNLSHIFAVLSSVEPVAWLLTLLALCFGGEGSMLRPQKGGLGIAKINERPTDYRAMRVFVALNLLSSLSYPILMDQVPPFGMSLRAAQNTYFGMYWIFYLLSAICTVFIIAAILKDSLQPLPGLSSAALTVFRWSGGLVFIIALTAHIPIFGVRDVQVWMNEVGTSFVLCIYSFELSLLTLLLTRLKPLGMYLRSRPVGLALGLVMLGLSYLFSAVTRSLPAHLMVWVDIFNELLIFGALGIWTLYVIFPEPRRVPNSLTSSSKLMRWNEIALQLGTVKRPVELDPFISRVEATVTSILKKHNIGNP